MTLGKPLADLARAREGRRRRASSWDRTGGNRSTSPCVEAPIGDFLGVGHGIVKKFVSQGRPDLAIRVAPTDVISTR